MTANVSLRDQLVRYGVLVGHAADRVCDFSSASFVSQHMLLTI